MSWNGLSMAAFGFRFLALGRSTKQQRSLSSLWVWGIYTWDNKNNSQFATYENQIIALWDSKLSACFKRFFLHLALDVCRLRLDSSVLAPQSLHVTRACVLSFTGARDDFLVFSRLTPEMPITFLPFSCLGEVDIASTEAPALLRRVVFVLILF